MFIRKVLEKKNWLDALTKEANFLPGEGMVFSVNEELKECLQSS